MTTLSSPVTDRTGWLEARRQGLGGSDAAAVLNMHPYKSALRLYFEKRGELPLQDEETEAMFWGNQLEAAIASGYSLRTGRRLRRQPMKASGKFPFMLASIDRQIIGDPRGPGIYEGKNVNTFSKIFDARNPDDPAYGAYHLQAHHYMAVYGYSWASLAGLVGGCRLHYIDIDRDPETIDMLIEAERAFWQRVQDGDPPPVDASDDCRALLNAMRPETVREVELSADVAEAVVDLANCRGVIRNYEERKQLEENRIKEELMRLGATVGVVGGWGRVVWSQNQPSQKLDTKALKECEPDVYQKFLREQLGAIILRLAPDKPEKAKKTDE